MKRILTIAIGIVALISCSRVAPNYYGVLMENYGKNGKADYSKQQGRVGTMSPGTELFQVPAWEQRAEFTEKNKDDEDVKRLLRLKASDNTEFSASPLYSYKVIESKVVDVVFQNSRLGSGDEFMRKLEDNVLEPRIYDIIKEESRRYSTDTLMATGGSLQFEERIQKLIKAAFENSGLELISFSSNLDFSKKVKDKIDSRNEVNTNISVLDQQIMEQRKKNELAELKAQENLILSKGITPQLLQQQFIEKWDGHSSIYGSAPFFIKDTK
jgi:regulator of protease activity HflC (stomatin/prohibitin superfamily)